MKLTGPLVSAALAALLVTMAHAGTIVVEPYVEEWGYSDGSSGLSWHQTDSGVSGGIAWTEHHAATGAQVNWIPRTPTTLQAFLNNLHLVHFRWRCQWIPSNSTDYPDAIGGYDLISYVRKSYVTDVGAQMTGSGWSTASTMNNIHSYGSFGNHTVTASSGTGGQFAGESSPLLTIYTAVTAGVIFNLQTDGRWVGLTTYYNGGNSLITGSAEISGAPNPQPTSALSTVSETHYTECEVHTVQGTGLTSWSFGSVTPW